MKLNFMLFCMYVCVIDRYPYLTHERLPRMQRVEQYFIALNLYNSRSNGVLEALSDELLRLAYVLGKLGPDGVIEPDNIFVSIYESGSSDRTAGGLVDLAMTLRAHGIPHSITVHGRRQSDRNDHIGSMTSMRNAALEPLYESIRLYERTNGLKGSRTDRVIFINDVFWCAEDVLQLLADGDGFETSEEHASYVQQTVEFNDKWTKKYATQVDGAVSLPPLQTRPSGRRPDMVCAIDYEFAKHGNHLVMYDHWVFRDRAGERIVQRRWPFFADEQDRSIFSEARRMDVFSCWGGMVVIDGSLFSDYALRIRARTENCAGSECTHVCADIFALKGSNAWIQADTLVGVTYSKEARDALSDTPWFNPEARLQHRTDMIRARSGLIQDQPLACRNREEEQIKAKERDVASSNIIADTTHAFCRIPDAPKAEPSPFPFDPHTPHMNPAGESNAVTAVVYGIACPSHGYPSPIYRGIATPYPPTHWCCGNYIRGQHYWMNCHHVPVAYFTETQRNKWKESDFSGTVDLHAYDFMPDEWA
jgi:hypothetical protein